MSDSANRPTVVTWVARRMDRRDVRTISARLRDISGVDGIEVDARSGRIVVHGAADPGEIAEALRPLGAC